MSSTVFVINPNSNESITAAIDRAVDPLRAAGGPGIECITLPEGPPGIQSQRDVDGVIPHLLKRAAHLENRAAAFVIACFSDPGLHSLREQSARPVLGIAECGILTALTLGQRFGIIAILQTSIARHLRYVGAMGVSDRLAADLPINVDVAGLANEELTLARMVDCGRVLRQTHGADVVVMGCSGMAKFRAPLESAIDIPVVEPTQAAVTMAVGRVRLGATGKTFESPDNRA